MSHIKYRRDIDGLRTIAVLPVVLYHAELPPFSGGFVGVDVFFVISGFLITSGLMKDVNEKRFSLFAFYDRRFRRILPALAVVTLATLIYGAFVMLPSELVALGQSAISVATFSSNIWFWSQLDYFGPAPYESPLLHSWSLSVEEQFYIFWPLIVWLFTSTKLRKFFFPAMIAATVISFVAAEVFVRLSANFAFYMFPLRAWELLIGSLLAVRPQVRIANRTLNSATAVAGFALVLVPMLTYSGSTLFPGISALPVCLGTAMLLIANAGQDNVIARLLGTTPMVFIGKLSYSLYLWHWPVIAFFWLQRGTAPSYLEGFALVGASIVLAYLSLRYIESPFRQRSASNVDTARVQRRVLVISGATLAAICVTAAPLIAGAGFPGRLNDQARMAVQFSPQPFEPEVGCAVGHKNGFQTCVDDLTKDSKSTLVLWGDSHARALGFGVTDAARNAGISLRAVSKSGCSPLPGTVDTDGAQSFDALVRRNSCYRFNDQMLDAIAHNPAIRTVIMSGRWARFVNDGDPHASEALTSRYLVDREQQGIGRAQTEEVLGRSLERAISTLEAGGKKVVLMEQAPSFNDNARKCVARALWRGATTQACAASEAEVRARRYALTQILEKVSARHPNVTLIDPLTVMCRKGECPADDAGLPLYVDDHHVTRLGSTWESKAIPWQNLKS